MKSRNTKIVAILSIGLLTMGSVHAVESNALSLNGVWLQGINVQGINLQGMNLQGTDSQGLNFLGENLKVEVQGFGMGPESSSTQLDTGNTRKAARIFAENGQLIVDFNP